MQQLDKSNKQQTVKVPSAAEIKSMTVEQAIALIESLPEDVSLTQEQTAAFTEKLRAKSAPNRVPTEDGL